MLEKLLALITEQGAVQISLLAHQLDVSPALVEEMIKHLERVGSLKPVESCTESHCSGCPVAQACGPGKVRLWQVVKN